MLRCRLHTPVLKRQREPGHLTKVFIVLALVLVSREEYAFNDLTVLIGLIIELYEEGSEFTAWRAIVHAEVEH